MNREQYLEFLKDYDFNNNQIKLIIEVRKAYENFEKENEDSEDWAAILDSWECDQWYVFNRSGLFEEDDIINISEITSWHQDDTRMFVTEIDIEDIRESIYPL